MVIELFCSSKFLTRTTNLNRLIFFFKIRIFKVCTFGTVTVNSAHSVKNSKYILDILVTIFFNFSEIFQSVEGSLFSSEMNRDVGGDDFPQTGSVEPVTGLRVGGQLPKVWKAYYDLKKAQTTYEATISPKCLKEGCVSKFADAPRDIDQPFWYHVTFCYCNPDQAVCHEHIRFCEMCDIASCERCLTSCHECKGLFCRTYCIENFFASEDGEELCKKCAHQKDLEKKYAKKSEMDSKLDSEMDLELKVTKV